MALIIGVTGAIATGKSGVCWHLVEKYDALHGDADKLVHRMFDPGTRGYYDVIKEFGREVLLPDGYVDRKKIGDMAFGNPEVMSRWMKAIGNIETQIRTTVDRWRAELGPDDIAILEAVNHIEAGYAAWCDATWLVAAEPETMKRRLMARNNFTEEEAEKRMSAQRPWQTRAPGADHVFHNDGTVEELMAEVDRVMDDTIAKHRAGTLPPSVYHAWREANPRPAPQRPPEPAKASS
ncbi:MAG: dephospho-CoA kinase [Dehalococcoidia bacterium]|nr:dephospho-CoA kinase [Dehalococcoidia bacterium]